MQQSDQTKSTSRPSNIDLMSRENVRNPFPLYDWLRENDPVHWSQSMNAWVVTRYEDVHHIFERHADFSSDRFRRLSPDYSSRRPEVKAVGEVLREWMAFRDPPDHTRLRQLVQKTFTPRQLEKSREDIRLAVDDLLASISPGDESDFMRALAFPLPAMVIALLLGAPIEDLEEIKVLSDRLAAYLGGSVGGNDNFKETQAGLHGLVDYFSQLVAERRKAPRDDLLSIMIAAEHEGDRLSGDEVVANAVLLLWAGHETTTNLLGNGLYHLMRTPKQFELLKGDHTLMAPAIEELLRFDSPVAATSKVATRDLDWHGKEISAGQLVMPFIASANRDPEQFSEPNALNIQRKRNRHLAFSYGIHFCLGAPLSRLEAEVTLQSVFERFPNLQLAEPDEPPDWKPRIFLRGLASLPVVW